ncbi:helix-turn-helix domain-containing protein [Hymenobacter sediminicola]|uniref:Helix-turn-helix domain-containing protein n=1 Tax=Hymenobacter sediminicola TaxID=2761579 RepID=A0A7G7W3E7_9BACT|nr:helix-turn-helix transcriptional regulator [Hymenobacter sediminicola]QNH60890.1 helix-turn-helix domain-containing protein [Hymenobacter sediminicola]
MWFGFNVYSGGLLPFFVQGIVVAAVLWARRRREGTAADGWLALLLLLFAGRLAQWMLGFAGWYDSHDARTTFMFYWPFSNWLAVGPGLYFYFRSLTNQEFRLERRHGWHFVPVALLLLWRLLVFGYDIGWWHGIQHQPLLEHFGTKGPLAFWADQQPIYYLADALGYLSVLAYAVRSLREYRAYARYLNDNFSDTEKIRLRWLRNVLVAVVAGTGITLAFGLIGSFISPLSYYESWYDYLFTGVLIYYLSIAGLLTGHRLAALRFQPAAQPVLATNPSASPDEQPAAVVPGQHYAHEPAAQPEAAVDRAEPKTLLVADPADSDDTAAPAEADAELARWTKRLLHHMQVVHPYLEPELTLGELAAQLRTNTSWLSKVINTGCEQNFNDFINEYRVREAERRLRDPKFRHYTLLAVALEAGFNSKSTFNRVFKKLRGLTPSEVAREE